MSLLTQLLGTLPKAPTPPAQNVSIQLTAPLTPSQTQNIPIPVLVTVGETLPNPQTGQPQTTLTLPSGQTLTATLQPPLTPGTQLTLPKLPTPQNPTQLTAQMVKTVLQPPTPTPATQPAQLPTPPQIQITNLPATQTLTQLILSAAAAPNTLPAGPAQLTFPQPLPANLLTTLAQAATPQPVTLTATQPTQPGQPQPATLTLSAPTPTAHHPTFTTTVQTGQPLPTNQPVQATLLPPIPGTPQQPTQLTITLPATPFTPPATTPQSAATPAPLPTPAGLTGLKITFPENQAPQPQQQPITLTARILTPPPAQAGAPTTQTAILSTGQTVQLQSPTPLPSGTVLTMALDFTSPAAGIQTTVLRLTPTNGQPQPQQQQTNPNPAAQQAPVQTVQAPPPPGALVGATVTGQTLGTPPQAILTLTSPQYQGQTFTLPTNQSLPVGTSVQLQFQPGLQAALLSFTLPHGYLRSHTATTLAQQWPTLTQGLQHLAQSHPNLAGQAQRALSPEAFLPTFLSYASQLLSENPTAPLPGDVARLLSQLGHDLGPELAQLQSLAKQPDQPDQWRAFFFPYLEDQNGDPRQGRFFWRQQPQEKEEQKPRTRFVLEVAFTNLGDLQLDGLIAYPEVWLKLRSRRALEPTLIQQLQQLTTTTFAALGLTGGISAETTATFPLNPLADLLREDPTTVSVET